VAVQEVGLREADDPTVLEWAAHENRTVVTQDVPTMLDFAYERGLPMPRAAIIDELVVIAKVSEAGE
jgi:predicted nuclease of predicted toxin-antitoxin system